MCCSYATKTNDMLMCSSYGRNQDTIIVL